MPISNVPVNDSPALEQEADVLGSKAQQLAQDAADSVESNAATVVDGSASVGSRVEAGADLLGDALEAGEALA